MASRTLSSAAARSVFAAPAAARSFHATTRSLADGIAAAPLPVRKPVGAFRGGLLGFLLGSTVAGAGVYGYILREYKTSNELLTEDIYALQNTCQKLNSYVQSLEEKFEAAERRRK